MMPSFLFSCPRCHAPLGQTAPDELCCRAENLHFKNSAGVWHFLLPDRAAYFEQFIYEYETIRRAEGRGSQDSAYYRALPYQDLSGRMPTDWRIRAASFDALLKHVFMPWEQTQNSLRVVDLGAGNGWLSNRLALRGHTVMAVDLTINDFDGLGCQRFYESTFLPLQAEFDQLPFSENSADIIIFNAALHYSVDIQKTLAEAQRILAARGKLIILDSPVYRNANSGARMIAEREQQFIERYGFPSNALPSQNYLTYHMLNDLGHALKLDWQFITPFYGLNWMLRPMRAALFGQREPAKFHLIVGHKL